MTLLVTCLMTSCACMCILQPITANCGGLQGDVVFLLDASGSVGSSNFQTMLSFVSDLVDDFDIGVDNVRVGVLAFASSPSIAFHLNAYYDKTSLKNAVMNVYYTGGGTNTASAINTMTSTMFSTSSGDRSSVPNVGIVITDGLSSSFSSTSSAAASARAAGTTMFSIGVGTGVSELNAIATDPDSDHVFTVSSFSGLTSIESVFQAKACTTSVLSPVTCAQYTCHNGGQCSQVNAGAVPTCQCTADYSGATCQTYIGPVTCAQYTCYNGGQCTQVNGSFPTCQCTAEYSGATCQSFFGANPASSVLKESDNSAAIAGGVTAGVAALGLVLVVAVCFRTIKKKMAVSAVQETNQGHPFSEQDEPE